jgi:pimeloyl-ACP methyl ester carboxylesterase
MTILKTLLLLIALGYFAILVGLFFFQTALLFPTRMVVGSGGLPQGAEALVALTPDGETLHGVHLPPRIQGGQGPLILAFGGNAWNAEAAAAYLHDLYPERDIVAFHYRGYRPSTGAASAAALLADAPFVHDVVAKRFPSRPIVAVGFSIGSGVAAHLARQRDLAGLILVTPFDSLSALAAGHYRWLPVRLLLRHRMEPAEDLAATDVPVALIAGQRDTLIPAERTAALRKSARNIILDVTVPGAGHNDIYQHPALQAAMRQALDRIAAQGR